jgi:hypothetical protein
MSAPRPTPTRLKRGILYFFPVPDIIRRPVNDYVTHPLIKKNPPDLLVMYVRSLETSSLLLTPPHFKSTYPLHSIPTHPTSPPLPLPPNPTPPQPNQSTPPRPFPRPAPLLCQVAMERQPGGTLQGRLRSWRPGMGWGMLPSILRRRSRSC